MPLKLFNFHLISVGGSHEPLKQVQLTATFLQSTKFMFRNRRKVNPALGHLHIVGHMPMARNTLPALNTPWCVSCQKDRRIRKNKNESFWKCGKGRLSPWTRSDRWLGQVAEEQISDPKNTQGRTRGWKSHDRQIRFFTRATQGLEKVLRPYIRVKTVLTATLLYFSV